MAQRRMFSKVVTNSSEFLMMSPSAQTLYFHLGMNADDDGFCEVFTVMRMTESKPDDLRSLAERGFIYIVDNKVCIMKDWHENNYIQTDRYTKSKYLSDPKFKEIYLTIMSEKVANLKRYTNMDTQCIHDVSKVDTQVRLGKVRKGKERTTKSAFGEFQKVKMTEHEKEKLIEAYGRSVAKKLVDELDQYIESTGKKYKSHYATLLAWARRKKIEKYVKPTTTQPIKLSPEQLTENKRRLDAIRANMSFK